MGVKFQIINPSIQYLQHLQQQKKRASMQIHTAISKENNFEDNVLSKIPFQEDNFCQDCQNDSYDEKLSEYLFYKLTKSYSSRVLSIKHPKIAEKEEYTIAYCAKKFRIYKCRKNTIHLQRFGKKVPMIKQSYKIAQQAHGKYHRDGIMMMNIVEAKYPNIIFYYIRDFIIQFPSLCLQCKKTFSHPKIKRIQPISNIWGSFSQKSINGYHISKQKLEKNTILDNYVGCLDCSSLEGICQKDQYQPGYLICHFILEEKKFPLIKYNQEAGQLIAGVKKIIMQMEVRRCQKGTLHLWYANPRCNEHLNGVKYTYGGQQQMKKKKNWQRVLMKRQSDVFANILHHWSQTRKTSKFQKQNEQYHMNLHTMRSLMKRFSWIYPFNVMAAMKNTLARCKSCNVNRIYRQLDKPKIIFDDNQIKIFKMKQQQSRRQFLENGKSKDYRDKKVSSNTEQVEAYNNNGIINLIDGPTALYEQSQMSYMSRKTELSGHQYIQGFTEPGSQAHQPEVQKFLNDNYGGYPQILSFLNNDLIWNEESGPPPELYEFEQQIQSENDTMFVKKYGYDRMRRVVVVINQKMKQMYSLYGDSVSIDYIPSLIKRRSPAGWHFSIGIFTGQDSNFQNVIFGICFLSEDLMIYHKKSLEYFFEGMNKKTPETLITSNQKATCQAVDLILNQNPEYKFKHHISWFYIVQHLKSLLIGQLDQEQMLQLYCRSILQKNPLIYKQLLKAMTARMVEKPIIQQFKRLSHKYCLSCLDPCFVGFGLSTNRVLKIYELVEKTFLYQGRVARFFYYAFKLQRELAKQSKRIKTQNNKKILLKTQPNKQSDKPQQIIKQLNDEDDEKMHPSYQEQLFELADVIQQQPFKILYDSFNLSNECVKFQNQQRDKNGTSQIMKKDEQQQADNMHFIRNSMTQKDGKIYRIDLIEQRKDMEIKFRYPVVFSIENNHWQCPCNWIYITGLPCHHLLKIIRHYGGSIKFYVSQRWIVQRHSTNLMKQEENNYSSCQKVINSRLQNKQSMEQ